MSTEKTETVLSLIALASLMLGPAFLFLGLRAYSISYGSEQWPHTAGTVIYSHVGDSSDFDNNSQVFSIKYEFSANERRYESNQVYFKTHTGEWHEYSIELARDYPIGKTVTVYYKPEQPEVAVLIPGVPDDVWGMSIVGGLMTFTYLVLAIRDIRRKRAEKAGDSR